FAGQPLPAGGVVQSHQLCGRTHFGFVVDVSLDHRAWYRAAYIPDGICRRTDDLREMDGRFFSDHRLHRCQLARVYDCAKEKNIITPSRCESFISENAANAAL